MQIRAVLGDIVEQDVDAVVNAANQAMRGGGGVDGAIHRAAGPDLLRECVERFPGGLATGDAGWTGAGDMRARWIIHTVGPNHAAGQRDRSLLVSCYRRSLEVADQLGARTVAFPLVSAGIYGWPREDAIRTAVRTLAETPTLVEEARIVTLDQGTLERIQGELATRTPWLILHGVRVLHERGFHQVRVLTGISRTGLYWQVSISIADNVTGGFDWWRPREESLVARYTTAQLTQFAGGEVASGSPSDTVAALILAALPVIEPSGGDPEYVRWFAGLLELAEQHDRLPIAYDEDLQPGGGWALSGHLEVRYPEPPAPPRPPEIARPRAL